MAVTFLTDIVMLMIGIVIGNSGKIFKGVFNNLMMKRRLNKLQQK